MDGGTGQGDVSIFSTGDVEESLDAKNYLISDDSYKGKNLKTGPSSDYNANIDIKEAIPPVDLQLLPCGICGRTFQPESLGKHTVICQKTSTKKRKTFDSFRQRREGTELAQFLPKNFGLPENSPFAEKEKSSATPKMPTKKHSPRPSGNKANLFATPENAKCPHCGRGFGARAFDRHVAWCAERTRLAVAPGASSGTTEVRVARSRLMARTSYKAPPVRTRRSLTREKYSLSRSASVDSAVSDRSSNTGDNHRRSTEGNGGQHLPVIMKTSKDNEPVMTRSLTKARFDDDYDPFLLAKRQMMSLMSSSSNIPKLDSSPAAFKKESSPFRNTNTIQHTPRITRDESSISQPAAHSPNFQRSYSLRSPSNKYNFTGRLINTKLSNKPTVIQQNNSSEKHVDKKAKETPKIKNTNIRIDNKNKTQSYESSPFLKRTEKHRAIKLEPVDKITPSHNQNNNNLLDSSAYKNNISDSQENFIDPQLINDKIPPSVQKLLDNPILLSSTESLDYDKNLKSSIAHKNQNYIENIILSSDNNGSQTPTIDDLSAQYDKIMISLEQSMNSQLSLQDEDALYNDLEQLMASFDDRAKDFNVDSCKNINTKPHVKAPLEGSTYSKKPNNLASKAKQVPYNKSISLNFSSVLNNPLPNPVYPIYSKSHSVHENQHQDRKLSTKVTDQYKDNESQLETDIMKSLKDIDLMCDSKASSGGRYNDENALPTRKKSGAKYKDESPSRNKSKLNETIRKLASREQSPPSSYSGKQIGDSAYGRNSLNRSSPSNQVFRRSPSNKANTPTSPVRNRQSTPSGDGGSSRHSPVRDRDYISPYSKDSEEVLWLENRLSSSESDASISNMTQSLSRTCSSIISTTRLSKFCHDCGNKFPFETAKFCTECGAKRLVI